MVLSLRMGRLRAMKFAMIFFLWCVNPDGGRLQTQLSPLAIYSNNALSSHQERRC